MYSGVRQVASTRVAVRLFQNALSEPRVECERRKTGKLRCSSKRRQRNKNPRCKFRLRVLSSALLQSGAGCVGRRRFARVAFVSAMAPAPFPHGADLRCLCLCPQSRRNRSGGSRLDAKETGRRRQKAEAPKFKLLPASCIFADPICAPFLPSLHGAAHRHWVSKPGP